MATRDPLKNVSIIRFFSTPIFFNFQVGISDPKWWYVFDRFLFFILSLVWIWLLTVCQWSVLVDVPLIVCARVVCIGYRFGSNEDCGLIWNKKRKWKWTKNRQWLSSSGALVHVSNRCTLEPTKFYCGRVCTVHTHSFLTLTISTHTQQQPPLVYNVRVRCILHDVIAWASELKHTAAAAQCTVFSFSLFARNKLRLSEPSECAVWTSGVECLKWRTWRRWQTHESVK